MAIFRTIGNAFKPATFVGLALLLGGCALSPFDDDGIVRQVGTTVGTAGKLSEPKDFVKESRPDQQTYQPVGVTPAPHAIPPRAAAGVQSMENELNALRQRNEQAVSAPKPPSPYDGKVEPGYKQPEPPPLPAYTGPKVDVPELRDVAKQAASPPQKSGTPAQKSTNRKPKEKKAATDSAEPTN